MKRKYRQYIEGESVFINNKEYRFVTVRKRSKLVSRNGDLINPFKPNQKVGIILNRDGYPCAGGHIPVHLYVAHAWVDGWFEGAEVNHIDMNRKNYDADNLEWVTHLQNIRHSVNNSNHYNEGSKGIKNGRSTFTEEEVKRIKFLFDKGYTTMEVVRMFYPDCTFEKRKQVWSKFDNIKKGKTWK